MSKIFISYRRADSETITGRIYDRLVQRYQSANVLMDVDSMIPGFDFRDRIGELLQQCDIMIAVVGTRWAGPADGGHRRIDEESDWVRIEIESGLKRKIPIIPVLVDGAEIPSASTLPQPLKDFAFRQGMAIGRMKDFHPHVDELIKAIDAGLKIVQSSRTSTTPQNLQAASATDGASTAKAFSESARDQHLFGPGRKKILAIDGGGVRVVVALAFLERLEAVISQQKGRETKLGEYFDLVGGTSMGAAIATLVALGYSTSQIREVYLRLAPALFGAPRWRFLPLQPKFSWSALSHFIGELLGDRSLDTGDLITGLAIMMKRLDNGTSWALANNPRAPYWNTPADNVYFGNKRYRLADLLRASMAMPMYFEPVELPVGSGGGKGLFIDASMGIHNNPVLFLFLMTVLQSYGLQWETGAEKLSIASLGTGTFRQKNDALGSVFTKHLKLALYGLTSTIQEADAFVLSQMHLMGDCPLRWPINSEIGMLTTDRPFGPPLFRFMRYDVRLEAAWLENELSYKTTSDELAKLRSPTPSPNCIPRLYEIAARAAEKQVKAEHWSQ